MLNMNVPFISLFLTLGFQEEEEMGQRIFYTQLFMLVYLVKFCLIPTLVVVILVKNVCFSRACLDK